ncbi:MAG: hypothetical protein ABR576_08485 [Thermoanaerobaculia bacterium]
MLYPKPCDFLPTILEFRQRAKSPSLRPSAFRDGSLKSDRPRLFPRLAGVAAPAALFALLVVAVYADPLFTDRQFGGRDLTAYNLPVEKAIHDAYARLRLPVWMDGVSGGRPLLPNPNIGALYPVRPLLALLPFEMAAKLFPVLHWALAGIGTILFLRRIGLSAAAGWMGAVTYVFSGASVSEVFFPHLPGLALLPWILWALSRLGSRPGGLLALSLLLALDLLAGDVFTVGLALLAGTLWILLETPRAERPARLGLFAGALLLAVFAAAPQIVATALWIPETNRSILGLRLVEVFYFSIRPERLLELVVPFPFGETWAIDPSRVWSPSAFGGKALGMFATLYAGALAAIAVVETWKRRAAGLRFARALGLVCLLLAVLPSLMPPAWSRLQSPLALRNPEKLAIGLSLALAVLAAHAIDAFRADGKRRRWLLGAGAALALAAGAFAWSGRADVSARGKGTAHALADAGLLWMATVLAAAGLRSSRRASALSLIALTAVPIAANRRIAATFRADEIFAPTPFARRLDRADPGRQYRVLGTSQYLGPSELQASRQGADPGYLDFSRRSWDQYVHLFWRRGTVLNYDFDAGDLSRVESLRRVARTAVRFEDAAPFFGALALRFAVRFRDQPPLPGYQRMGGDALQDWDEHSGAFPDLRLLTGWLEAPNALAAVNALPRLAAGEVVLETGRVGRAGAPPGRWRALEESPERLVVRTESPAASWLFALRGHWRHRTVRVDGELVDAVPAQVGFTAVPVPAGAHTVEWREEAPGWRASRWGPVLYLLGIAWVAQRKRSARPRTA